MSSVNNAENQRRCYKCGRSPAEDSLTKLFRFPKPGITNTLRCELWAKYCFPDKEHWSPEFQQKLHTRHLMLCNRHFSRTSFSDYPETSKKLHRFAVPDDIKETEPQPGPSHCHLKVLNDITNCYSEPKPVPTMKKPRLKPQPGTSHVSYASCAENNVLSKINHLSQTPTRQPKTPKEQYLLTKCRKHLKHIWQLRNRIKTLKNKDMLKVLHKNKSIDMLMKNITPTFALLLQAQIKNVKKKTKGRRWTTEEKVTALRLYKRSPTCYRLLRRLFCLPSESTLKFLLSKFSLKVGVNECILNY